jgi:hypothetical protein
MKKRRPTIGDDPLAALIPAKASKPPSRGKAAPKPDAKSPRPSAGRKTDRVTYNVQVDLIAETRNAVLSLGGHPLRLTLAALVESALRRELERLRKAHNGGKPFKGPGTALKGGRPLR